MNELMILEDTKTLDNTNYSDKIEMLVSNYNQILEKINIMDEILKNPVSSILSYYQRGSDSLNNSSIFSILQKSNALKALNSEYWQKAFDLTKVKDYMPYSRRKEWDNQLQENNTPDFTIENVRTTIIDLLNSRKKFFAERVDGIFRGLSGSHVTNCPQGFSKRMIFSSDSSKNGFIDDLRTVIAKFMGRDDTFNGASSKMLSFQEKNAPGQWFEVDGGALKVKVYKIGTVHVEVHPDIAWQLNEILSILYPMAIPSQFRKKPKKAIKEHILNEKLISFEALKFFADKKRPPLKTHDWDDGWTYNYNSLYIPEAHKNSALKEIEEVLVLIGGERKQLNQAVWYEFNYNPFNVLTEISIYGAVLDKHTHQYHPTKGELATYCVEKADIQEDDEVLEPSAGQGGLANLLPKERTTCIEIARLNSLILKEKGFNVIREDFLKWSRATALRFDKVVMNPPFSDGRALSHLKEASDLIKDKGRIVAILPASMRGKNVFNENEWDVEWSKDFKNMFDETNVVVTVLTATKK